VDEPILRHTGTATTLPTTGDNALYYHRNQQYSIVGLTNAAGTLVERYTYSAYGTLGIYAANGTVRSSSTYANRYTYTGREWDSELRLYHFRARWYDPATGGFVSRDPLGYVDGMSLYRGYFGVRGVDPSGRLLTRKWQDLDDLNLDFDEYWRQWQEQEARRPLVITLPPERLPEFVDPFAELLLHIQKYPLKDTCVDALGRFRSLMRDNPYYSRAIECRVHIFCDKNCTGHKNPFWGFAYTSPLDKSRAFVCLNESNLDGLPHAVVFGLILHELVHVVDLIDNHGCPCA
jgi:RHS repeat-associated protein